MLEKYVFDVKKSRLLVHEKAVFGFLEDLESRFWQTVLVASTPILLTTSHSWENSC